MEPVVEPHVVDGLGRSGKLVLVNVSDVFVERGGNLLIEKVVIDLGRFSKTIYFATEPSRDRNFLKMNHGFSYEAARLELR